MLVLTGGNGVQIDVVITSCSCFAPTPSMAAMILNKFKMRSDVLTYSLAGMGCSSSLICVDMAKHLLKVTPPLFSFSAQSDLTVSLPHLPRHGCARAQGDLILMMQCDCLHGGLTSGRKS